MKKFLVLFLVLILALSGCSKMEYDFNIPDVSPNTIEIPSFNKKEPKLEIEVELVDITSPQETEEVSEPSQMPSEPTESEEGTEIQPEATNPSEKPSEPQEDTSTVFEMEVVLVVPEIIIIPEVEETQSPKEEESSNTINLSNYTKKISYSGLTETEIEIVNTLLSSDCTTEEIDGKIYRVVTVDEYLPFSSYLQVNSFFVLRTSQWAFEEDMIDYYTDNITTKVCLNMDMYEKYMANRASYDKKINNILGTFTEGTEAQKLKQIAKYLKENVKYNEDLSDGISAIMDGQGNCNAYALAFKDMASRLGIQCDLCLGTAKNGGEHAWNRVTLSNGDVRYYDICWYDSFLGIGFIDMKNNPHRDYKINNYY